MFSSSLPLLTKRKTTHEYGKLNLYSNFPFFIARKNINCCLNSTLAEITSLASRQQSTFDRYPLSFNPRPIRSLISTLALFKVCGNKESFNKGIDILCI